jgi:hypothetical protein
VTEVKSNFLEGKQHQQFLKNRKNFHENLYVNNRILAQGNDSFVYVYYADTITVSGPGKYLSLGGESGNNAFYDQSLIKPDSVDLDYFISQLKKGREQYCDQSLEHCSDLSEFERSQQQLAILEAYYHQKMGNDQIALSILNENQINWQWTSNHHDLMIGILLKMKSKNSILKELIKNSHMNRDQIELFGLNFYWKNISDYQFADYQEVDWETYFKNTIDRILKNGI